MKVVEISMDADGCDEPSTYLFDSVSAAAVFFANEAKEAYGKDGLEGDDLLFAVAKDVALLFSRYDATTAKDPEEVTGGSPGYRYGFTLKSVMDEAEVKL